MTEIAVVVGVSASNGLGAAIARRFAKEGLQVVVSGRTENRLQSIVGEIEGAGGSASYYVVDATVENQLHGLIKHASGLGTLKSVIFNVGNNLPLPFSELTADTFEDFWRVCVLAGFLTAKAALPELEKNGGTLLFTGASASMRGRPNFAHFGSAKAGLRNMAQAIAKDYGPKGVHVGHVVVDGAINGDRIRERFASYLDHLGEDGSLEPDAIADAYWFMHAQPRSVWTFEVDVRPFKESW
jgi:NAD(P)-dependent dehydrogenase (short-subunit alcohol dehydrogenase family)